MMSSNLQMLLVVFGTFMFVATTIMIFGSYTLRRATIRSRLASGTVATPPPLGGTSRKVINRIDDKLIGLGAEERTKLRFELLRAGFFSPEAPKYYVVIRSLLIIAVPCAGFILIEVVSKHMSLGLGLLLFGLLMYLGYIGPNAFVKRRQAQMVQKYRAVFPDFLDLLLVCVNAGLSFDAALIRVSREFATHSPEFATNLALLGSEMRSGRGTADALSNMSERLGLEEAKCFSTLLKQSIELGSDIGDALRTYSDEMRDKRMARAEAIANVLPVKMTIPLTLFIFPVLIMVICTPLLIKIFHALRQFLH